MTKQRSRRSPGRSSLLAALPILLLLDLGMDLPYLFRPAVGDAPGGVGATGNADTTAPLIIRSVPSGELVSTVPLVTKSTTSTANSTGLSE